MDKRDTDFKIDWIKYRLLSNIFDALRPDHRLLMELTALLREARADAIRFIEDVKADELRKAFADGQQSVRDEELDE